MSYLPGKAVVVTGAGRGLGAAYARLAAAQGAAVVVNDIDVALASAVAESIVDGGGRAVPDGSDIATWDGAGAVVEACVREYGAIHGLVNNAAIFQLADPVAQDPEVFRRVIEINLLGTAYCGLHAIRAMLAQGTGSVVNVTSGAQAGAKAMGAYGASKGGVATLTYCWALDVAGTGVRVNAMSPNAHTRMSEEFERYLGAAARSQNTNKAPELNAPAVVYLLSDASAAVNGQVVRVDANELSLMTHPAVLRPALTSPQWTVESVAAAFADDLAGRQQAIGLV
jgi:NAD(P)-dependent dehydrogenase (short-subunit alcohol dehydrogenase family)